MIFFYYIISRYSSEDIKKKLDNEKIIKLQNFIKGLNLNEDFKDFKIK
jgi:hypothetical protein